MSYFVTGATGFIGRNLVEQLLEREGTIYVLVREGSRGRLEELRSRWGADEDRIVPVIGDLSQEHARLRRSDRRAEGEGRPLLPPRRDLRHDRGRREPARRERRGDPGGGQARQGARREALPHGQLDRGRRPLQGHLHARTCSTRPRRSTTTPTSGPSTSPRRSSARSARALAGLPAGDRRRPLRDRRDGQGRRPLLLLQAAAARPQRRAAVVPGRRHRGAEDQHRAGGLRRQGDGPHRPHRRARRPGLPPDRPQPADRGPGDQHLRQGRPRARGRRCGSTRGCSTSSPSRSAAA